MYVHGSAGSRASVDRARRAQPNPEGMAQGQGAATTEQERNPKRLHRSPLLRSEYCLRRTRTRAIAVSPSRSRLRTPSSGCLNHPGAYGRTRLTHAIPQGTRLCPPSDPQRSPPLSAERSLDPAASRYQGNLSCGPAFPFACVATHLPFLHGSGDAHEKKMNTDEENRCRKIIALRHSPPA